MKKEKGKRKKIEINNVDAGGFGCCSLCSFRILFFVYNFESQSCLPWWTFDPSSPVETSCPVDPCSNGNGFAKQSEAENSRKLRIS